MIRPLKIYNNRIIYYVNQLLGMLRFEIATELYLKVLLPSQSLKFSGWLCKARDAPCSSSSWSRLRAHEENCRELARAVPLLSHCWTLGLESPGFCMVGGFSNTPPLSFGVLGGTLSPGTLVKTYQEVYSAC